MKMRRRGMATLQQLWRIRRIRNERIDQVETKLLEICNIPGRDCRTMTYSNRCDQSIHRQDWTANSMAMGQNSSEFMSGIPIDRENSILKDVLFDVPDQPLKPVALGTGIQPLHAKS